jgi:HAD superfamily hydrolase (TIGR01509 family)
MSVILFGSISSIADTSELQRESFNEAFEKHGLDWRWDRDDYAAMLGKSGGRDRVSEYAASRGEDVDVAAVHATKSEIFQARLASDGVQPRPGVVEIVEAARGEGTLLGLVTTTSPENVAALTAALQSTVDVGSFDVVVDSSDVEDPKPAPAAYAFALDTLGVQAAECVAVEDNPGGVQSAAAAGVSVVAFPNENTADQEFEGASVLVDHLDYAELRRLLVAS